MELLDKSAALRRLAWGVEAIGMTLALGYLAGHLPWDRLLSG